MLAIDTHAHLFSENEKKYPPRSDPSRPPTGTGTINHLQREMKTAGVTAVCAVQVSGFYRFDNRYILDSSKANPDWIAGVITLDPENGQSPRMLEKYARQYGIRGMRSVATSDGRLEHQGVRALWRSAADNGIVVNLLIKRELADQAERLAREFPNLQLVIDHCLGLQYESNVTETLEALKRLSERPNIHAKVSSIANGPDGCSDGFPCQMFHPVIADVIRTFGSDRCVWGAHFPLEKYAPALTYEQHLKIYTEALPLSADDRALIVGGTANRLWFDGRL